MTDIKLIFFDVGGVLGTNGWDHEQRGAAVAHFRLDESEFAERHREAMPSWEEGRITMEEYLDLAVFFKPRPFSRPAFRDFMFAQSHPFPDSIALAKTLRQHGTYRLMTLNNEARELNQYRIDHFGLVGIFDAFLTSCYLAVRKPLHAMYERALSIAQVPPEHTVFIDDRAQNLAPPHALGVHTILFTSASNTARKLTEFGIVLPRS